MIWRPVACINGNRAQLSINNPSLGEHTVALADRMLETHIAGASSNVTLKDCSSRVAPVPSVWQVLQQ
jgi:hypothetical protein